MSSHFASSKQISLTEQLWRKLDANLHIVDTESNFGSRIDFRLQRLVVLTNPLARPKSTDMLCPYFGDDFEGGWNPRGV